MIVDPDSPLATQDAFLSLPVVGCDILPAKLRDW